MEQKSSENIRNYMINNINGNYGRLKTNSIRRGIEKCERSESFWKYLMRCGSKFFECMREREMARKKFNGKKMKKNVCDCACIAQESVQKHSNRINKMDQNPKKAPADKKKNQHTRRRNIHSEVSELSVFRCRFTPELRWTNIFMSEWTENRVEKEETNKSI